MRPEEVKKLLITLSDCADIEERVKNGRINDKMGVELMIIKYSTK